MSRMANQEDLASKLTELGFPTTARGLEEWRAQGLLPALEKVGLGHGRGTQNRIMDFDAVLKQAISIHKLRKHGCRGNALKLNLFFLGFPIDPEIARGLWRDELQRIEVRVGEIAHKFHGLENFISKWAARLRGNEVFGLLGLDPQTLEDIKFEIGSMIFDPDYQFDGEANSFLVTPALEKFGSLFRSRSRDGQIPKPISEIEITQAAELLQNGFSICGATRIVEHATRAEFSTAQRYWIRLAELLRSFLALLPSAIHQHLPSQRGEPLTVIAPGALVGLSYLVKFGDGTFVERVLSVLENAAAHQGDITINTRSAIEQLNAILGEFNASEFRQKLADFRAEMG